MLSVREISSADAVASARVSAGGSASGGDSATNDELLLSSVFGCFAFVVATLVSSDLRLVDTVLLDEDIAEFYKW